MTECRRLPEKCIVEQFFHNPNGFYFGYRGGAAERPRRAVRRITAVRANPAGTGRTPGGQKRNRRAYRQPETSPACAVFRRGRRADFRGRSADFRKPGPGLREWRADFRKPGPDFRKQRPGLILVDGNRFYTPLDIPWKCVVGGDGIYADIAAASVLAKTRRDEIMVGLDAEYPLYGWRDNKGYATRLHRIAIREHGLTPYHRLTFNSAAADPALF